MIHLAKLSCQKEFIVTNGIAYGLGECVIWMELHPFMKF